MSKTIYLIGSLRNPEIPLVANYLRSKGWDVFDEWYAAGERADDAWRDYEIGKGNSYKEAHEGYPAKNVFNYDLFYINRADAGVLVLPAGKSGHLELGYMSAQGKPTFVLADGVPERYDVMSQFASGGIHFTKEDLEKALTEYRWKPKHCETPKIHFSDAMWLAGLMEGEGCFHIQSDLGKKPRPRITLSMTDYDVMSRACGLLQCKLYGPYDRAQKRKDGGNKKPVYTTALCGPLAIEWMRILRPYMGVRRQAQIDKVFSVWNPFQFRKWRAK